MRIAFITSEFVTEENYAGGLSNYLGRFTSKLSERGHKVHVFTRAHRAKIFLWGNVMVHRVVPLWDKKMRMDRIDPLVPRSAYMSYQDLKAAWSLYHCWKKTHAEKPFDLVQTSNVMAVGLFFRRVKNIPITIRLSSFHPEWGRRAKQKKSLESRCRTLMEYRALKKAPHAFAPSKIVVDLTKTHYKIKDIRQLPTLYFNEKTSPADFEELPPQPYGLFFGTKSMLKGVHILAQALPHFLDKNPNWHFVCAGNNDCEPQGRDMNAYLKNQVGEAHHRLHLFNTLPHTQLYPLIENSAFVVIPSLAENISNACLEAMGHSKVVIATTGSSFEELLKGELLQFLVPPGDAEALGKAMCKVVALGKEKRKAFGKLSSQYVSAFHPDMVVPMMEKYYQELITMQP